MRWTVAVSSAGTVAVSSAGTVAVSSAGTVAVSSAGTVAVSSAGTVAVSSAGTVAVSSAGADGEAFSPHAQMWLRLRLRPSTSVVSALSSVSWPVMIQKWSTADGLSVLATVIAPAFWKVAVMCPESPCGLVRTKCQATWPGSSLRPPQSLLWNSGSFQLVPCWEPWRSVAKTLAGARTAAARSALTASHPAILNFRFIWSPVCDSASLPSCVG